MVDYDRGRTNKVPPLPVGQASYIVLYADAGNIYAVNNNNGKVEATSSQSGDAYTPIQYSVAAGNVTSIRSGNFFLGSGILYSGSNKVTQGFPGRTVLQFDGSVVPKAISNADASGNQLAWLHFRDFNITSTTSGAGTGIDMGSMTVCKAQNLWMSNMFMGIDCNVVNGVGAYYNYIDNLRASVMGSGSVCIAIRSGANETTVMRTRLLPQSGMSIGVMVNTSIACALKSVNVETRGTVGIDIQQGSNATYIDDSYLELNDINLQIASGVIGTTINGGYIIDATTANVIDSGVGTVYLGVDIQRLSVTRIGQILMRPETLPTATTENFIVLDKGFTPPRMRFNIISGTQFDFLVAGTAKFQVSAGTINCNSLPLNSVLQVQGRSSTLNPTTSDITSGTYQVWTNTLSGTTFLYFNAAGAFKTVQLT